jgi:S1-C subfamily serine protease
VRISLAASILLAGATAAAQAQPCPTLARYVYKLVLYGADRDYGPTGFGGSVFLDRNGTLLTALHVLEDATGAGRAVVEVSTATDWLECPVEVVLAASRDLDAALLRVRIPPGTPVEVPRLAGEARPGDIVSGFRVAPPAAPPWHASGIVCTAGRVSEVSPAALTIRGDYFFVRGSSGSPVFDGAARALAIAIEMLNWNRGPGPPDWTYTALPIRKALSVPRLAKPIPLAEFLARGRRSTRTAQTRH